MDHGTAEGQLIKLRMLSFAILPIPVLTILTTFPQINLEPAKGLSRGQSSISDSMLVWGCARGLATFWT